MKFSGLFMVAVLPTLGCGGGSSSDFDDADGGVNPDAGPPLAAAIGTGDHGPSSVTFTTLATSDDEVQRPTDLAFNPLVPDDLWVVNYDDDSVVIVHDASTDEPRPEYKKDWYGDPTGFPANHFMAKPATIAFGGEYVTPGVGADPGTFATCGESRNTYGDLAPPNDFMGPALWSSDLDVFANRPGEMLGSHLDMLHCSPDCMGLAHVADNAYWAFTGRARDPAVRTCGAGECAFLAQAAIVRYDFGLDHGAGGDDHSDGECYQYGTGEVAYVPGVPSHLVYDADTELLYIADTGNGRIAALDTSTGTPNGSFQAFEPMVAHGLIEDADIFDVVPASSGLLEQPSGLELHEGFLYVADNATGIIHAFDTDGTRVNWLDTGRGRNALAGIAFGPDDKLYLVDMRDDEVVRIDP